MSLWFPRLGAERLLRQSHGLAVGPLAVVQDRGNMQVLSSLSAEAEAEGLCRGQPLRDAQAMCPALVTRLRNPQAERAFLAGLRRWAGKYSPWVGEEPPEALVIDISGCAHLFGGEEALLRTVQADCAALGVTVCAGVGDTVGAAWALARHAGQPVRAVRTGDAIEQEARASRSRARRRRGRERGREWGREWGRERDGAIPAQPGAQEEEHATRIAAPGQMRAALAPLPVAALRLSGAAVEMLTRLGLHRVEDLMGMPRAALARRAGADVTRRLDQALGVEPEPVSPIRAAPRFAVRLTLPEPIGLQRDILAGLDRLLPALGRRLHRQGRGARRVRLHLLRTDQTMQWVEVGLARPSADPDRIRPLLAMKLGEVDAGFGIDVLRLEAVQSEPIHARQHKGHLEAASEAVARQRVNTGLDELIGRLGARIGLERITRLHPAESHLPEKCATRLAAAWSEPAGGNWPVPPTPRPLLLWRPEAVMADDRPALPLRFRWRARRFETRSAIGPERIAPEWWLDDPDWRSGVRDYWRVVTASGERLWLYYAHGGAVSSGWFCHGLFA